MPQEIQIEIFNNNSIIEILNSGHGLNQIIIDTSISKAVTGTFSPGNLLYRNETGVLYPNYNPSGFITASAAGVSSLNQLVGFVNLTGLGSITVTTGTNSLINISGSNFGSGTTNGITTGQADLRYYPMNNPSGFIIVIPNDIVRTTGNQNIIGIKNFTDFISTSGIHNNSTIIDINNNTITDSNGNLSINWLNRLLVDGQGTQSIDWESRIIKDGIQNYSILYHDRLLQNSAGANSLDWKNSILLGSWSSENGFISSGIFRAQGPVDESVQGIDRIDIGVQAGTPRMVWEKAGYHIWEQDNDIGNFRSYVPPYLSTQIFPDGNGGFNTIFYYKNNPVVNINTPDGSLTAQNFISGSTNLGDLFYSISNTSFPLMTSIYTVSELNNITSPKQSMQAFVTDAIARGTSPVIGGGSVSCPVWYDGTQWIS